MLIHCGHSVGMVLFVILFQDGGSFCSTPTELPHVMSTAYHLRPKLLAVGDRIVFVPLVPGRFM